eukprot:TRINITY_DN53956_c0_g1_i2.p1 TRINITY_DN53956_c0_g1~~TRINITY_DN53956_c0_g1_i2.p1  ORF type:complete len:379 (+),score=41.23 TRINITY_DN53956_c0_g1_i2:132-1268(+)
MLRPLVSSLVLYAALADTNCVILAGQCAAQTGLGDRLGVLLNLAALARTSQCKLATIWSDVTPPAERAGERPPELFNFTHMSRFFSSFRDIAVLSTKGYEEYKSKVTDQSSPAFNTISHVCIRRESMAHGRMQVHETAFQTFVGDGVLRDDQLDDYMNSYRQVGRELQPTRLLARTTPEPYFALHIRKYKNPNVTASLLVPDLEKNISTGHYEITYSALAVLRLFLSGWPVMVLGDTPEETSYWEGVVKERGYQVKERPRHRPGEANRMTNDAADFFALAGAAGIVAAVSQRGGWSSFSAVAAMARNLPYLVVHSARLMKDDCRLDEYVAFLKRRPQGYFIFGHSDFSDVRETQAFCERMMLLPPGRGDYIVEAYFGS